MITTTCDKCGKKINTSLDSEPGERVYNRDLCKNCFKKWLLISRSLERRTFNKFIEKSIKDLKNITPFRLERDYRNKLYNCPCCGKLYTTEQTFSKLWDVIKIGEEFECVECGALVVVPLPGQKTENVW